jgi:hypothetical protein
MARRYLDGRRFSPSAADQALRDDLRPTPKPAAVISEEAQAERQAVLAERNVRGDQAAVAAVRQTVIDRVLRHPFRSREADITLFKTTIPYAAWCFRNTGGFDPEVDLDDHLLADRIPRIWPAATESSRATRMSNLRRLRRGPMPATGFKRMPQPPLSDRAWLDLNYCTRDAGKYAADARVLLALTGGAGLHASEVIRARGDWVTTEDQTLCVWVPDHNGEYRVIPLSTESARVLRPIAVERRDEFILRPDITYRKNVITSTNEVIRKRTEVWREFSAVRARHYWLAKVFTSPVPFVVACAMAGIRHGNHLPADIVHFIEQPTNEEIIRRLRVAMRHERGIR